jgi:hypothetical protein
MQRARRLVAVAVVTAVGVLALAGCRSQPGVAAYVGDTEFSQNQVDRAFDSVTDPSLKQNEGALRQFIVSMMVVSEVAERHAGSIGKPVPKVDAAEVAQGAAADSDFARLQARYTGAIRLLQSEARSVEPDEQLRRMLFDQLVQRGAVQRGVSYEQVRTAIDSDQLRGVVGVRNLLAELAKRYDVVVNPAFAPLELHANGVPIAGGQAQVNLDIPVTVGREPVVVGTRSS